MNMDEPRRCDLRDDIQLNSQVKLPEPVVAKVLELIRQDDVRSSGATVTPIPGPP